MLERVDVDAAIVQCHVWCREIAELYDFYFQTEFLFGDFRRFFRYLSFRTGDGTDFQVVIFFLAATG